MHDLEDNADTTSNYECLACGEMVSAETRPNQCPECDKMGSMQNRTKSLE